MRHCTDNEVMGLHLEIKSRVEHEITSGRGMEPLEDVDVAVEVRCAEALQQLCQTQANIIQLPIDLDKSIVTMKISKTTEIDAVFEATFTLIAYFSDGKPTKRNCEVFAHMTSTSNGNITNCIINQPGEGQYSIKCTPTIRGRHEFVTISPAQLGNPVTVFKISASGIAVNSVGEIVITVDNLDIVKIDREQKRQILIIYAKHDLEGLNGVAVDSEDNIYCTTYDNKILTSTRMVAMFRFTKSNR